MTAPPTDAAPPPERRVVLLVAHGSRNPAAATEHERLCAAVQAQLDALDPSTDGRDAGGSGASRHPVPEVRAAYLELSSPSIPAAIDSAVSDGASNIRLLPHFLSPGNHVLVDLPRLHAEATERHPQVHIELVEHLGADPALVGLLGARALAD